MPTDRRVPDSDEARRGSGPWPIALALGLLLMISGSLAFLWTAIRHPDAVIAGDAFSATRAYESAMQSRSRAEARGWHLETDASPSALGIRVRAVMRDDERRVLAADRVLVHREHPSAGGLDATFVAHAEGDAFVADVPLPREGEWRVWVRAEREGETLLERLTVKGAKR